MYTSYTVLSVPTGKNQTGHTFPHGEGGMNTLSENGNDFVGRLLHGGGGSRRTFSAFPQYPNGRYGIYMYIPCPQTQRRAFWRASSYTLYITHHIPFYDHAITYIHDT